MTCANNCRGVDPNSVIIGGTALAAVASAGRKKHCKVLRFFFLPSTVSKWVFLMPIFQGGLGALTPGILGVGAAGTLGGAAVVNQMMDSCPASRPCQVDSQFSHCALCYTLTRWELYYTLTRWGTHRILWVPGAVDHVVPPEAGFDAPEVVENCEFGCVLRVSWCSWSFELLTLD